MGAKECQRKDKTSVRAANQREKGCAVCSRKVAMVRDVSNG